MTSETVLQIFAQKIADPIESKLITLPGGGSVPVDIFTSHFSEASETPTYAELVEIDGGTKGYIPFFDECKDEGLLN